MNPQSHQGDRQGDQEHRADQHQRAVDLRRGLETGDTPKYRSAFADWQPKPGPTQKQFAAERGKITEERLRVLIEAGMWEEDLSPVMVDPMWKVWKRRGSKRSFDVTVEMMPAMLDRLHEMARMKDVSREEVVRWALAAFLGIDSTTS